MSSTRGVGDSIWHLLITADGGGSNGPRVRLWKRELQRLANEIDIEIAVKVLVLTVLSLAHHPLSISA